jgi:hypothetical protein
MATTISEPPKILTLLESSKSLNKMTGYSKKVIPKLGPFLLLKTLGTGEFGKVKLGRHVETGQTVSAVDVCHHHLILTLLQRWLSN